MSPGPSALFRFAQEGDPLTRFLRTKYGADFSPYSDEQIDRGVKELLQSRRSATDAADQHEEADETRFRGTEFEILRQGADEDDLVVRPLSSNDLDSHVRPYIQSLALVERLRETRVFSGFTRVYAENGQTLWDRKSMLWKEVPRGRQSWLPAYVVHGEGIFLQLNEANVTRWEAQKDVIERYEQLAHHYEKIRGARHLRERAITPRLVLVHTLAHLLIARLTFECGYSAASLKERLYVSNEIGAPMAGVLIYTADGDADGTLGGLVRMGKPQFFEPLMRRALEKAVWCSADPVCMEAGRQGGQGPDSVNLAACHACTLLPETACEEFNRFLDRAAVVGDFNNTIGGFFSGLLDQWGKEASRLE